MGPMRARIDDPDLARRTLLALAATLPALAGPARSSAARRTVAELPPDLIKAVSDYDRATTSNDVAALANLVADDYVLVNSDSSLQDKQSYLKDFTVPGFKLDPYTLEQQVRKVWGDAALLAGQVQLSWTLDGKHESRLLRIAHVWAKVAGRWRIAYTQLTRVPNK
jgi:ketosteroid isomerase-like protein